jgi:hypothetical protein
MKPPWRLVKVQIRRPIPVNACRASAGRITVAPGVLGHRHDVSIGERPGQLLVNAWSRPDVKALGSIYTETNFVREGRALHLRGQADGRKDEVEPVGSGHERTH